MDEADLQALLRQRALTFQSVPAFLRGPFRRAVRRALTATQTSGDDEEQQTRGWKLLLLVPRVLLRKSLGQKAAPKDELLDQLPRFEAGEWAQLLAEILVPRNTTRGGDAEADRDERRCERALALVRQGEVSAARQALTASDVAPGTQATLNELRDPARRLAQPREPLSEVAACYRP